MDNNNAIDYTPITSAKMVVNDTPVTMNFPENSDSDSMSQVADILISAFGYDMVKNVHLENRITQHNNQSFQ